jgi:hypothetical protein
VVWFFAASKAASVEGFEEHLRTVQKGPDFLRRFRQEGAIVELSRSSSPLQRAVEAAAAFRSANRAIKTIDAAALFYFGIKDWADAGELMGAARRAAAKETGALLSFTSIADVPDFVQFVSVNATHLENLKNRLIDLA